ncbi:hypothetical protein [Mycobacterium sp.]|uniref:hypothetical protein n=1 Tax=Mycobacterium sp. TaxID=1785 RepID=UPI003BABFFCA
MGRKVAVPWHASFSIGAGVLYFYFVLPRSPELMGDVTHTWATALRIVTGALIGLAALPVVFTLLRTRKPEFGIPQLALSLRTWSIVAHVLAGILIVGTSISEIWLSLDAAGRWLFGIYGAAAAIAVLAFCAFYLSFIAELPPPPPKPLKPKKPKKRRVRGKKASAGDDAEPRVDEAESTESQDAVVDAEEAVVTDGDDSESNETAADATVSAAAEGSHKAAQAEPKPEETTPETPETQKTEAEDATRGGLRNRRPTGKTSHRRKRTRRGVTVEE